MWNKFAQYVDTNQHMLSQNVAQNWKEAQIKKKLKISIQLVPLNKRM